VSRYKFYRSREIVPDYKIGCEHWSSIAVQTISEPENYHGVGTRRRADAGVRMQEPLEICLDAGSKAKSVTSQLTFIDRVRFSLQFSGQVIIFDM
jgi:hypothetical protein